MEAIGGFVSFAEAGQDTQPVLGNALGLLRTLGATAVQDAALLGFRAAADFAGDVEELSRTVEYLQLVAAGAVDRTRNEAAASAGAGTGDGWLTGWKDQPGMPAGVEGGPAGLAGPDQGPREVLDDGFRNTTEFLRARLRINAAEARRRLALAGSVLPRRGLAGRPLPAVRAELGAALASGTVASRAATIITVALDRVRHTCDAAAALEMEHALARTAAENDPDFLARIARRWTDALDQDGAEPSEEALRHLQGAFIRRTRHGLHHLEIFATADQFEHLLTVMNTATNPRTSGAEAAEPGGRHPATDPAGPGTARSPGEEESDSGAAGLDRRSRPQKLLDGLVGTCKAALATGNLPAAGGLRPQVMVTIGYRDLLDRLGHPSSTAAGSPPGAAPAPSNTGTLPFIGPVTAATVRKIACDADIIPVLLGGEGRILDIGRASRIFPPHIRKAITARDQGCAFPGCTIPAPWCEAHHISYWSRGGTTSTENGTNC